MKISKIAYQAAVDQAYHRGCDDMRPQVDSYRRSASEWRNRFEQLKADGPDIKNELEGAFQRGQRQSLVAVRGQLISALDTISASA